MFSTISCQLGDWWDFSQLCPSAHNWQRAQGAQPPVSREPSNRGRNTWPSWLWVLLQTGSGTSLCLTPIPPKASAWLLAGPFAGWLPSTVRVQASVLVSGPDRAVWVALQNKSMRLQNPSIATSYLRVLYLFISSIQIHIETKDEEDFWKIWDYETRWWNQEAVSWVKML